MAKPQQLVTVSFDDPLTFWGRMPGTVSRTIGVLVAACALITAVVVAATAALVQLSLAPQSSPLIWQFPLLFCFLALAVPLYGRAPLSRAVRLAALLPLVHFLALLLLAVLWVLVLRHHYSLEMQAPVAQSLPVVTVTLGVVSLIVALTWVRGRQLGWRRPQPWLQYAVAFSLANVLLQGLFIPFGIRCVEVLYSSPRALATQWRVGTTLAALPAFLALASAIFTTRWPRLAQNFAVRITTGATVLLLALFGAILQRGIDYDWIYAYGSMLPYLTASACIAVTCVVALAVSHWKLLKVASCADGADRVLAGEVLAVDGCSDEVAWFEDRGWLLGYRMWTDRFAIRTDDHRELSVPAGTPLVAPLPLWSTRTRAGERGPVLKSGARVWVTGSALPAPNERGPFRTGAYSILDPATLVIFEDTRWASSYRELTLLLWRPALAYVTVATIAALPGVATYLALPSSWR